MSSVTLLPVCMLPCECSLPSWLVPVESISKPHVIIPVLLVMLWLCRCSQCSLVSGPGRGAPAPSP